MTRPVRITLHNYGISLLLVSMILLLIGCGRKNETEVVFWALGAEGEQVAKMIPEFERRHPEIKVRVQMIPWNAAHEKLLTAFAGSSLPDLCQLGNTWIPEFTILQAIENLNPWIAASATVRDSSYFPGIWETNKMDSALYGLPWYVDTRVLFYRSDLLASVGYSRAPGSWDEWRDVNQRLKERYPESYAVLLPTNNEWAPEVILGLQLNSPLLKDKNTLGDFSGPEFVKATGFFYSFFENGWAPVKTTQIVNIYQAFAEGVFAMYITGPWNIGEFSRRLPSRLKDAWMTAPMPGPDGGVGTSLAGGSSLVMFSSSPRKAAAWKLIEFLSEPAQQLTLYRLTGDLPARLEAWRDSSLASNPYAHAFFEQLRHVTPTPKIPEWEQVAQKVREYGELIAMHQYSVDEALTRLDKEVDVILEKRRWLVHGR